MIMVTTEFKPNKPTIVDIHVLIYRGVKFLVEESDTVHSEMKVIKQGKLTTAIELPSIGTYLIRIGA